MNDQNEQIPLNPEEAEQVPSAVSEETIDLSFSDSEVSGDTGEFSIDDIIAEFHDAPDEKAAASEESEEPEVPREDAPPQAAVEEAEAPEDVAQEADEDAADEDYDPDVTGEIDEEFISSGPILFKPRYRGTEMRKQIVNGPERRYYELQELGVGKLQLAMLFTFLAFLLSAGTTAIYHFGMNIENQMRLLVFSQVFSVFLAAIFGCYLLMDGIGDLFRGRFTLNTFLTFTFFACAADCIICLKNLWMPFGAVLCLEVFIALLAAYEKRTIEMGQTDTMRKANYLDATVAVPDFYEGKVGYQRRDGEVSEFLDTYTQQSDPEKYQSIYALAAFALSLIIAGLAYFRNGGEYAFHVAAGTMLLALPATFFLTESRPMAILEQRLHKLGVVICGWQGVKGLCQKSVYPLKDGDIFPVGTLTLNGVKFYGEHSPDQIIGYATALSEAQDSQWAPVFLQLLESRSGPHYMADEFVFYDNGGVGGIINEQTVLMGTGSFMKEMGVEIPAGNQVDHPIYLSIDNVLCAVFALTYHRDKLAAAGLSALAGCSKLTSIYTGTDSMVDSAFLNKTFKVRMKRFLFPETSVRRQLADLPIPEDAPALLLTTKNHLAARAYAISGARTLRSCVRIGTVMHIVAGCLGMLAAAAIAFLANTDLLNAGNVLLYHLLWFIPGFILTEWTRAL